MKKILSFILLLTLSFAFSACGGSDDDEPEKFVWGGDWNDPNDPHYATYKGMYNPIQGLWRFDWDENRGMYFSDDFKVYDVTFYSDISYKMDEYGSKYMINDKAFKIIYTITFLYKIEGNKLYYVHPYGGYNKDINTWDKATKVEK